MDKYFAQVIDLGMLAVGRDVIRASRKELATPKASTKIIITRDMHQQDKHNIKPGIYIQGLHFQKTRRSSYCIYHQRHMSHIGFNNVFSDMARDCFIKQIEDLKKVHTLKPKYDREASVLVPLCFVDGKPSVLFTVRSVKMGRNKGDVSFPGGMKDSSDKNIIDVALRETKEEIGILPESIKVWTSLPSAPSQGKVQVIPVVSFIGSIDLKMCTLNSDEVESVFSLTLESLCDPKNFHFTRYNQGFILPIYIINDHRIWGLTAGVLHYILKVLIPEFYRNNIPNGIYGEFYIEALVKKNR